MSVYVVVLSAAMRGEIKLICNKKCSACSEKLITEPQQKKNNEDKYGLADVSSE